MDAYVNKWGLFWNSDSLTYDVDQLRAVIRPEVGNLTFISHRGQQFTHFKPFERMEAVS